MKKIKSKILVAFIGIMFMVCLGYNKGAIDMFIDPVPMPYLPTLSTPEPETPIIPEPETPIIPQPDTV